MFDYTSRYYAVKDAIYTAQDGRQMVYKQRRFLPQGETQPILVNVTTLPDDRLDLIAGRTLGNPELFWRVCDASNAMNPFELMAEPGTVLHVPTPQI